MALSHSPSIVTDGLVLCLDAANRKSYPGTGTAWRDLSQFGSNGTINGATYLFSNSGILSFDGVNDSVSTINVNLSTTNCVTVDIFLKLNSYVETLGSTKILFEVSNNFNNFNEGFVFGYADNSNDSAIGTSYPISLGNKGTAGYNVSSFDKNLVNDLKWHHWTCIFDRSVTDQECILYIDGILRSVVHTPQSGFRGNNTNNFGNLPVFIGARNSSSFFSHFDLGSLKIYNRLLNENEIRQNFNALRGRFGI